MINQSTGSLQVRGGRAAERAAVAFKAV